MQNSLFGDDATDIVAAATVDPDLQGIADALPKKLYLGTSSWNYPGWTGLVWDREYPETKLSRYGLSAYARHPLLRTVGIDRSFYRPLSATQFAMYTAQVPAHFRFVVKAPNTITDALVRDETGRGKTLNQGFLDADAALRDLVEPALAGLGDKLGALVFQISPLPQDWFRQMPQLIERLHTMLRSIPNLRATAPDCAIAVEVRDQQWLTREFTAALRDSGVTYCMGLHAKMPRIAEQLPVLRALWPGPLVCRWNLNPLHGAYGYEEAQRQYEPYNRIQDPDVETRNALARVIAGTIGGGQNAYITLSNKAEGSAPLSVIELAKAVRLLAIDRQ